MLKISLHLSPFFPCGGDVEPACKILIFRLFSHCFNDVVNLNNIIALSNDFKIGYFVGLAVKFAYDAGVVSTGAFGSAAYHDRRFAYDLKKSGAVTASCSFPHSGFVAHNNIFYYQIDSNKKCVLLKKQKLPHYRSSHCILFRCYFISGPL